MNLNYQDRCPDFNYKGYTVTNEDTAWFSKALNEANIPTKRALAICSGGEVPLTVLLPRCEEVIAVDYSIPALVAAMSKALLIADSNGLVPSRVLPRDFKDRLPKLLRSLKESSDPYADQGRRPYNHAQIYWPHMIKEDFEVVKQKLSEGRISFIHGDIARDTTDLGRFDLVYLSNALEYNCRDNKRLKVEDILDRLSPGGLLITTENGFLLKSPPLLLKSPPLGGQFFTQIVSSKISKGWKHCIWQLTVDA